MPDEDQQAQGKVDGAEEAGAAGTGAGEDGGELAGTCFEGGAECGGDDFWRAEGLVLGGEAG